MCVCVCGGGGISLIHTTVRSLTVLWLRGRAYCVSRAWLLDGDFCVRDGSVLCCEPFLRGPVAAVWTLCCTSTARWGQHYRALAWCDGIPWSLGRRHQRFSAQHISSSGDLLCELSKQLPKGATSGSKKCPETPGFGGVGGGFRNPRGPYPFFRYDIGTRGFGVFRGPKPTPKPSGSGVCPERGVPDDPETLRVRPPAVFGVLPQDATAAPNQRPPWCNRKLRVTGLIIVRSTMHTTGVGVRPCSSRKSTGSLHLGPCQLSGLGLQQLSRPRLRHHTASEKHEPSTRNFSFASL